MTRMPLSYTSRGSVTNTTLDAAQVDNEELPKAPQTPAVRLTRRQLAKLEEEEALSKSQRAPSPQPEEDIAQQAAEGPAEPAAAEPTVDAEKQASPEKDETPVAHNDPIEIEPKPAKTPARRTRRQQPITEEEQVIDDTADVPPEQQPGEVSTTADKEDVAHETETTAPHEGPVPIESEPAPKPKRLTRRQQAKLGEEQKRAQAEEQAPTPQPTEEEALGQIVAEAQAEVAAEQEVEAPEETAEEEVDPKTDAAAPELAADEQPILQDDAVLDPHMEDTGVATPTESQTVELQVPEVTEAENASTEVVEEAPATPTGAGFEADPFTQPDEVVPSVEISVEAEPKMLSAEKPFDEPMSTPVKNPVRPTSRSPSKSPMRLEESISAIDRLEEDLESIGKAIPDFDHSDDERLPRKSLTTNPTATTSVRGKTPSKTPAKTPARTPAKVANKTPSKTPAKASVTARAPVASKAPVAAKPSVVPSRISRVPSAAAPKSVKPTTTSLARASSVRTAPNKDVRKPSAETADYLASKRRPISLSFPTPPPPPKGRAPTKPTFQLSSDNVAAKLKAQKEERLKREAGGAAALKQRPISMPPPPKSTKPPTVPTFQLSSEATAAKLKAQKEERLKRMEEVGGHKPTARPISMPPPPKSTKPVTKPSFQLPGEATAARLKAQKEERLKRMEEAEAAKKAALAAPVRKPIAHRPRQSLLVKDAPGVSIPPSLKVDAPQRSTSLVSKRSSVHEPSASRSTSTSSANRNSVLLAEGGKSTVTPVDAAALKSKGKQVFNRDRMEKEAMERERREKEEAAKKARAEAAERGRVASREWAERQRKKMMGQQV